MRQPLARLHTRARRQRPVSLRVDAIAVGVLALVVVFLQGCGATRDLLRSLDKPTARVVDARLIDLTAQGATIDFDVEIDNPYAVALPVGALDVALSSGGTRFLSAAGEPGATIPAGRSGRVSVPAHVGFAEVLRVLDGVHLGSVVAYRADLNIGVDIPGGERLTLPLSHEGRVPIPAPPTIALRGLRWDELSLQRARGVLSLDVSNPNEFAAAIRTLDYAVALGGVTVAEAALARPIAFEAGGTGVVEIPLAFSTSALGASLYQALSRGQIGCSLTGSSELGTPFGNVTLPVSADGQAPVLR